MNTAVTAGYPIEAIARAGAAVAQGSSTTLQEGIVTAISGVLADRLLLLATIGSLVLLGSIVARKQSRSPQPITFDGDAPESVETTTEHRLGDSFEARLDERIEGSTSYDCEPVRSLLRDAAIDVVIAIEGCSESEAEAAVDAGTWTDDDYVAAFLGTDRAPSFSIRHRLYDWAIGERVVDRRVDRTVSELRRLVSDYSGETGGDS